MPNILSTHISHYNTKRIHSHCDYMSPNDYEELYRRIQKDELLMAS